MMHLQLQTLRDAYGLWRDEYPDIGCTVSGFVTNLLRTKYMYIVHVTLALATPFPVDK